MTRKLHIDQQQIVEAIKRGAEDLPEVAKEAMEHRCSGGYISHVALKQGGVPVISCVLLLQCS